MRSFCQRRSVDGVRVRVAFSKSRTDPLVQEVPENSFLELHAQVQSKQTRLVKRPGIAMHLRKT